MVTNEANPPLRDLADAFKLNLKDIETKTTKRRKQ